MHQVNLMKPQFTSSHPLVKSKNSLKRILAIGPLPPIKSHAFKTMISVTIAPPELFDQPLTSMKNFLKKYSLLVLIVGLGLLIFFQNKVIMPLVNDVIKSDAFLVDTKDQGSQLPISTELGDIAFMHCNNYIKSELDSDQSVEFAEKPLKVWSLGNYQFMVNAEITIGDKSGGGGTAQKYLCRITYDEGENQEGAMDFDNWTLVGISGIEGL